MKTYTITLPDEVAEMADRAIASKRFESMDHLVLYAVAQVESELNLDAVADQEALRREIQIGIDQADRGEMTDGPEFMAGLISKLRAARQPS
jgi:Arc/MetJ-type ribon-helix-helix transcriptional regulator